MTVVAWLVVPASIAVKALHKEAVQYGAYGVVPGAMYGVFGNPNSLGLCAALVLPVLLWRFEEYPRRAWALLPLGVCTLYVLGASKSRASLAAALAGVVFYLGLRKAKLLLVGAVVLAMVGAVVAAYFPEDLDNLVGDYVYKGRFSLLESRLEQWSKSIGYIRERWFVGYGLGVSPGVSPEWELSASAWRALRARGSSVLAVWEETGAAGLVMLTAFPALVMFKALRFLKGSGRADGGRVRRITALTCCAIVGTGNLLFEEWVLAPGFFASIVFWLALFLLHAELEDDALAKSSVGVVAGHCELDRSASSAARSQALHFSFR
jgi:O-antigen ligase